MRASTEEFLYFLCFLGELLMRPTYRNLTELDFEGWAWRSGLGRRLAQLERQRLLEPHPAQAKDAERVVALTQTGRLAALGGRDPETRWARAWDGSWRVALFDLPRESIALRSKLHRLLRARHFGCLQGSTWLTPDPVDDWRQAVVDVPLEPEGFLIVEGRPASGDTDAAIVRGAWNFAEINRRYDRHLAHLRIRPGANCRRNKASVLAWLRREQETWKEAVAIDPLLPMVLSPAGYRGRVAWLARREAIAGALRHLGQMTRLPNSATRVAEFGK